MHELNDGEDRNHHHGHANPNEKSQAARGQGQRRRPSDRQRAIAQHVVEAKTELEKIREQVQNVE